MNAFIFICIEVEYLGAFCSVLFGFWKCNKINNIAHPLRIPGISVTSTPGTSFFHFLSINPIKPMRASDPLMQGSPNFFLRGPHKFSLFNGGPGWFMAKNYMGRSDY